MIEFLSNDKATIHNIKSSANDNKKMIQLKTILF